MKIAICDDEEQERNHLLKLLRVYELEHSVLLECWTFKSGVDLLYGMRGGEYDLIFLDVLMPGFSGLETAHELRELDKSVKLIFYTSSPEFAVESYSVDAYYYLLKPATEQSLFPLLDRVQSELTVSQEQGLLLKGREGVIRVPFAGLEYVEVMNKTVFFHLAGGIVHKVTGALADFEGELLARPEFLKIHRSYLVNLTYIQGISTKGALTKAGQAIPVSRVQYNQIKDAYMGFLFQAETKSPVPEVLQTKVVAKRKQRLEPWQILLVDDKADERTVWGGILESHGCVVKMADCGEHAFDMVACHFFDCVLLDVMLPDVDGFALCKRLQKVTHAPIIFLSCLTDVEKQMEGFACGGADYITKDTPAELFWAKVEARMKLAVHDESILCVGPLLLDLTRRKVFLEEEELVLTAGEFDLLWWLCRHTGCILASEDIFHAVWGAEPWDGGQKVQVHMSRLRRKLEKAWESHHFIETVWGQGYRFVPLGRADI